MPITSPFSGAPDLANSCNSSFRKLCNDFFLFYIILSIALLRYIQGISADISEYCINFQ